TTPLDGVPLAAVANVVEPTMWARLGALGIADPHQYFNAGVLLMNLSLMRNEQTVDKIERLVEAKGDELTWFDQDALNVVTAGRWSPLHPRWNAQNSYWGWGHWARDVFPQDVLA